MGEQFAEGLVAREEAQEVQHAVVTHAACGFLLGVHAIDRVLEPLPMLLAQRVADENDTALEEFGALFRGERLVSTQCGRMGIRQHAIHSIPGRRHEPALIKTPIHRCPVAQSRRLFSTVSPSIRSDTASDAECS
ncbi:hypothetical protein Asp14428_30560 [Actinoplanes sp. NBRC 14428]|nr:hypothetical protein Asp14428_30560 [Actinoplanes sp. NBRC 14428]